MKKAIALLIILSFSTINFTFITRAFAETEKIASIETAMHLAADSGGRYAMGKTAPALDKNEIALPVIDEKTGDILGYIVADGVKLIEALNATGLNRVAEALAADEALAANDEGRKAAEYVESGISGGTVAAIAAGVAAGAGIALAIGNNTTPTPAH
jgi:hypothetical protein